MRRLAVSFALIALCACVHAPSREAQATPIQQRFAGLDVYGTKRVSLAELRAAAAGDLQSCIDFYLAEDFEKFHACKDHLVARLQERFQFAFLDLSLVGYYQPGDRPVYGTFDVVEKDDAKTRMDFTQRPTMSFADPDGLVQAWEDYQRTGFELLARGELVPDRVPCPAFHCLFGHQHPRLKPFERVFVEGVRKNRVQLVEMVRSAKDDRLRGLAPFLLAYDKDGRELVKALSERVRDESDFVRNNIMRVFSDIALYHADLPLPLEAAAKVLNFPATTDRNKASVLFSGIAASEKLRSRHRRFLMVNVVPVALRMLRLEQPNNHVPAYSILRFLSGKDYGERDYEAWETWFKSEMEGKQ